MLEDTNSLDGAHMILSNFIYPMGVKPYKVFLPRGKTPATTRKLLKDNVVWTYS